MWAVSMQNEATLQSKIKALALKMMCLGRPPRAADEPTHAGHRPRAKRYYCECTLKRQLISEFSIENAEIMENCP